MSKADCKLYPGEGGFKQYFSDEFPKTILDGPNARFRWNKCPNIEDGYSDFERENYKCKVCGYSYTLYYDDMA